MMGHIPLYLNGSLSYISSRSFRPSLTLKPLDPILNTASLLLSLYSLPPPLEGSELSTSPVSPRHFLWPRSPCQRRLSKFIISSPPSTSLPPLCNSILHLFLCSPSSLLSSLIPFDQPSTYELDRPSHRQAMSTLWQVSSYSHNSLSYYLSSPGIGVV